MRNFTTYFIYSSVYDINVTLQFTAVTFSIKSRSLLLCANFMNIIKWSPSNALLYENRREFSLDENDPSKQSRFWNSSPPPSPAKWLPPSVQVIGWFSNRTGTSVDDCARKSNNRIDQWQSGKLGTGSRVLSFPLAYPSSNDVPVLLLNQPNKRPAPCLSEAYMRVKYKT